jgi:hypothetical protein
MRYQGKALTLATIGGVQKRYVFNSNRLRENAAASYLVMRALDELEQAAPRNGGEVLYNGGGGIAIVFPSMDDARAAVKSWSRKLVRELAPGLPVVVAHKPIDDSLRDTFQFAQKQLQANENRPPWGSELGALPVVRTCASTGLAALHERRLDTQQGDDDDEPEFLNVWLSRDAEAKWRHDGDARRKLQERYKETLGYNLRFPHRFDRLGGGTGESQIAVVHADGNDVGRLFIKLANDSNLNDGEFATRLRDLSESVKKLAKEAFEKTLADLVVAREALHQAGIAKRFLKNGKELLPIRPLVDGGDDLTFVCHGKLGLALACRYLYYFETLSSGHLSEFRRYRDDDLSRWTACAGVAIVPQKFPFARAYRLAESLSKEAKRKRREAQKGDRDHCWMDFQVVIEGATGELDATRETLYGGSAVRLQRPYRISFDSPDEDLPHNWSRFEWLWKCFAKWPRSRAKDLLESLARGKAAVEESLSRLRAAGLELPGDWAEYWDPIEFLDFHINWPLPTERGAHAPSQD